MNQAQLSEILSRLPEMRIGVLGDFCLDRYFDIEPSFQEVSRETGRPAHQVFRVRCSPGGAGNVATNVKDFGVGDVVAIGPLGQDGEGFALRDSLARSGINQAGLVSHSAYLTPTYNKPLVIHPKGEPEELDRIDIRSRGFLDPDLESQLLHHLDELFPKLNGLLVADQFEERNHHCVSDRIRTRIIELAKEHPDKVVFADSRARTAEFHSVLLKPNATEATLALGRSEMPKDLAATVEVGRELAGHAGKPVYITVGEEGVLLVASAQAEGIHIPGYPVPPPVDICGAGDTTIAAMAAALCAGASLEEAGLLGCLAASVTVQKIGVTGTARPVELIRRLDDYNSLGLKSIGV